MDKLFKLFFAGVLMDIQDAFCGCAVHHLITIPVRYTTFQFYRYRNKLRLLRHSINLGEFINSFLPSIDLSIGSTKNEPSSLPLCGQDVQYVESVQL